MRYPALTVSNADGDLVLAVVDDHSPTAAQPHGDSLTIFFADSASRNRARDEVVRAFPAAIVAVRDVDDEGWAVRSQQNLAPVVVGRLTVVPTEEPLPRGREDDLVLCVPPSIAFGTGHHATTRLCLQALQLVDLHGAAVLDVGTGSGILAIAAHRLGARRALGIDHDPDAVETARSNLRRNKIPDAVEFAGMDINGPLRGDLFTPDVVTANLTGTLLQHIAATLVSLVRRGGTIIVSGILEEERQTVRAAFADAITVWEGVEDGWVGMMLRT